MKQIKSSVLALVAMAFLSAPFATWAATDFDTGWVCADGDGKDKGKEKEPDCD